jgi:acetyltransferase-like isoleucine patch superfamily enzyme
MWVIVMTSTHDFLSVDFIICQPVVVENNMWIKSDAIILGGLRIGKNSVIGAESVVTHDISSNVFAENGP